ncbi:hypothetical protein [Aliiroseovarius sp. YM-037]|uniref:hypothetical protein n=1 Tax=Aliiroseovarius sp. YM-037 TaxID=3341728 RepID=UPI003A7FA677
MAKGDILEPVLDILFEFAVRIFFPRVGSNSILDELSWPWLVVLSLVGLAHISIRALFSAMDGELNEEQVTNFKNKLRVGRWALWGALFLSLFMFRFATSF